MDDEHGDGWCLLDDLDLLRTAEPPDAVRMVPAYDPYLQARDRDRVAGWREIRRAMWRAVANPGVILDGVRVVATGVHASGRVGSTSRSPPSTATGFRERDLTPDAERLAAADSSDLRVEVVGS